MELNINRGHSIFVKVFITLSGVGVTKEDTFKGTRINLIPKMRVNVNRTSTTKDHKSNS